MMNTSASSFLPGILNRLHTLRFHTPFPVIMYACALFFCTDVSTDLAIIVSTYMSTNVPTRLSTGVHSSGCSSGQLL